MMRTSADQRVCTVLLVLVALWMPAGLAAQSDGSSLHFSPLTPEGNGVASLTRRIAIDIRREPLERALQQILAKVDLTVTMSRDLEGLSTPVSISSSSIPAATALLRILRDTRLQLLVAPNGRTVLVVRTGPDPVQFGAVSGTVKDASSGDALVNARVQIGSSSRLSTITDASGRFTIKGVPPGSHSVAAERLGYARVVAENVVVNPDTTAEVSLLLPIAPTPLAEMVVTPGFFGMLTQSLAVPATLTRQDIETIPQLAEDLYRAATRLPGVSSSDMSSAFHVRGGTNDELYSTLDGLVLYEPFHLKDFDGGLSILDVAAIGGVALTTGGFGAQYGDRLTGVFALRTIEPPETGTKNEVALSLTNVRAMTQGAFADGRGKWLFSVRRGYLDIALRIANADSTLSPRYYDALGKIEYKLGTNSTLSAHVLNAGDNLHYVPDQYDPQLTSRYSTTYTWLTLNTAWSERLTQNTVASAGHLAWNRNGFQIATIDNKQDVSIADRRTFNFGGLSQDWQLELGQRMLLRWGGEVKLLSMDYDYANARRRYALRDGTIAFVYDTTRVNLQPDGTQLGLYIAPRFRIATPLIIETGLRYDRHSYSGDATIDPRLNIVYNITDGTTLRAAWGRYHQAQAIYGIQVQDGDSAYGKAESAEHKIIGLEHLFANRVSMRIEAYHKQLHIRPRWYSLDQRLDGFPELGTDRLKTITTTGVEKGIELFIKDRTDGPFDWSASYGLADARDFRPDGAAIPRDFDQRHTVYIDVAYRPNARWSFTSAWQYHSGWPITGYDYTQTPLSDGGLAISRTFHQRNSDRLPPYHRLDLRVTRRFETRRGRVQAFIDIFNLYNRNNPRAFDQQSQLVDGKLVFGHGIDSQIPRLPSAGVSWEF
jgi:hypothetical protein